MALILSLWVQKLRLQFHLYLAINLLSVRERKIKSCHQPKPEAVGLPSNACPNLTLNIIYALPSSISPLFVCSADYPDTCYADLFPVCFLSSLNKYLPRFYWLPVFVWIQPKKQPSITTGWDLQLWQQQKTKYYLREFTANVQQIYSFFIWEKILEAMNYSKKTHWS